MLSMGDIDESSCSCSKPVLRSFLGDLSMNHGRGDVDGVQPGHEQPSTASGRPPRSAQ